MNEHLNPKIQERLQRLKEKCDHFLEEAENEKENDDKILQDLEGLIYKLGVAYTLEKGREEGKINIPESFKADLKTCVDNMEKILDSAKELPKFDI